MKPLTIPAFVVAALFLAPQATSLYAASLQEMRGQIETILNRSSVAANTWSVYIENEHATTSYYSESPLTVKRPASVTKLFTTGAAFALLGPDYRFQTHVYHTGTVVDGSVFGDLHLTAEHDFTWSTHHYSNARTPLNQIAAALRSQGLRHVTGDIVGRGIGAFNGTISRSLVAEEFRAALIGAGITVAGGAEQQSGFSQPGPLLFTWQSMRLDQACRPINRNSVNSYADLLLRHIGWKLGGSDSAASGNDQVRQWLESIAVDTTGFRMRDGSGLLWSSGNDTQISALQSVELVRHMRKHYPSFEATLTVGCQFGTLGSRFCGTNASGNVYGKTGTLPNGQTVSLAGYVKNPHDGEIYYFAFIANQASNVTATRQAIDDCVTLLAGGNLPNNGPLPPDVRIVDHVDPEVTFIGNWTVGQLMGGHRHSYRWASGTGGTPTATATFRPHLPKSGRYNVYVWYLQGGNRSASTEHLITHRESHETARVDQRTGGSHWRLIGEAIPFAEGNSGSVSITNGGSPTGVIIADAVMFELVEVTPEPMPAPPVLHYIFNEKDGLVRDYGTGDRADGAFAGGSTRVTAHPAGAAGSAFATSSDRGHLSGGSAPKLNQMEQFTLTTWLNLRASPNHGDRLLSRQGSGSWPGFSWGISNPNEGTRSAANFTLNLFVGGETGFFGQTASADLSADHEWLFLAVTYDSSAAEANTTFYSAKPSAPVTLLGHRRHLPAGRLNPTDFSFQVAGTAATTINTAPHAWFDDVRVYNIALNHNQLETVRQENLTSQTQLFEQWQRANFTVSELSDQTLTRPEADATGEGVSNLLRYALGLSVTEPARDQLPVLALQGLADEKYLTLSFSRPDNVRDLEYNVQSSSDLSAWQPIPSPVVSEENGDGTVTMTYQDSEPVSAHPRRFLRLQVNR